MSMESTDFVHLHNHTVFSSLDGVAPPSDYFKKCAERKWPAFAITEHGLLSSIPDAYLASKEHKVKYIPGIEFYYNNYDPLRRKMKEKNIEIGKLKQEDAELAARVIKNRHITVLAKNQQGYENMLQINKESYSGFYYKPRVWFDLLAKYKEGLIVLSGCMNGPICHELRAGNMTSCKYIIGASNYADKFKSLLGDDFCIELQMPGVEGDVQLFKQLVALADDKKIKTVLTNDCHYITREDYQIQKVMMAIDQEMTVDDPNLFCVNSDEQFFKSRDDLRQTFLTKGFSEGIGQDVFESSCDRTLEIADKCTGFKPNLDPKLPNIPDANTILCKLALAGLKARGFDKDKTKYKMDGMMVTYEEQMKLELKRFIEKGFASYFLISRGLVKCSHDKGWPLGPARGSVGGSLVPYLIGIHELDPFKWGLSFNRFLSPSRGGNMLKVVM